LMKEWSDAQKRMERMLQSVCQQDETMIQVSGRYLFRIGVKWTHYLPAHHSQSDERIEPIP